MSSEVLIAKAKSIKSSISELLEKTISEWQSDSELPDATIISLEKAQINSINMHSKYISYYSECKKFNKDARTLDSLSKNILMKFYHGKLSPEELTTYKFTKVNPYGNNVKPLKTDIPGYIDADSSMLIIKETLSESETLVKVIEEILGIIKWRPQALKSILETKKFAEGMM